MSEEVTVQRDDPVEVAAEVYKTRYPRAEVIFLAGSAVRGESTPGSDLDLIVVFERLPRAYRESFVFGGWPVEAFVHDPETLKYFFFVADMQDFNPASARMVAEGIEVPRAGTLSAGLKQAARALLDAGPPPFTDEEERRTRYMITSMVNDLRHARSRDELYASGAALYDLIAYYYFRARNAWSTKGKGVPRRLAELDGPFHDAFTEAFAETFAGRPEGLLRLAEELLAPRGGFLFDGYRYEAPPAWRRPLAPARPQG